MCKKMSEMKRSGRIVKFTTAGAASALGTTQVTAKPKLQKEAAPMARVKKKAGSVLPGRSTP
jgi:hypothetical protein